MQTSATTGRLMKAASGCRRHFSRNITNAQSRVNRRMSQTALWSRRVFTGKTICGLIRSCVIHGLVCPNRINAQSSSPDGPITPMGLPNWAQHPPGCCSRSAKYCSRQSAMTNHLQANCVFLRYCPWSRALLRSSPAGYSLKACTGPSTM